MIEILKQHTLLIAEDEADTLAEITQYFGQYFRLVFQAKNGKQALEVFEKEQIDVALLDISMPHINGLEVAKVIKKINKNTQIVILSAHNESPFLLKAIDIGLLTYVVKPLNRQKAKDLLIKMAQNFKQNHQIFINSSIAYNYDDKALILQGKDPINLSKNEVLLLEAMLTNKNQFLSVDKIIDIVYLDDKSRLNYTGCIKTLISTLKHKSPDLPIHNKYGLGYMLKI